MRFHRPELVSKLTAKERADFLKTLTVPRRKTAVEVAQGAIAAACLGNPVKGAYGSLPRDERVFVGMTLGHRGIGHRLVTA